MNSKSDWKRVSKRRPCLVCGKPDWCLFAGPDDAPEAAICARTESARRCGAAGWLHRLKDSVTAWPRWERTIRRAVRMATDARGGLDVATMAERWRLPVDSPHLARLAASLALSPESLYRLRAGWSSDRRCWSLPMSDAGGRIVGIRLRRPDGRKLSVKGGKEGLFVPEGLDPGGWLLVCEGPTDTAALLDLGFPTVGRPSCAGGACHAVELVRRLAVPEVVIVADADAPGQRGAHNLASVLTAYCPVGFSGLTLPAGWGGNLPTCPRRIGGGPVVRSMTSRCFPGRQGALAPDPARGVAGSSGGGLSTGL